MQKIKIILNILMTIMMILLMKLEPIGLHHEVMGIAIFILFLIHKTLNYKFVKAVGKNIFNKKLKINSKIIFIIDIILFCFMLTNFITGILISKFIFKELVTTNLELITILHKSTAWWTLILISIHIGLHLERLVNYFTKKYKNTKNNKVIIIVILIIYIIFAILGIRSLCKYSIYNKVIPLYNNQPQMLQEKRYKNNQDNITEEIPTLEEYLNQFNCGECRKNCSLLNPKCEIGKKKKEEKINEYYKKYGNREEKENPSNNEKKYNRHLKEHKENNGKGKNKSDLLDVINVMILFIGGTYYINELLKKKQKNK